MSLLSKSLWGSTASKLICPPIPERQVEVGTILEMAESYLGNRERTKLRTRKTFSTETVKTLFGVYDWRMVSLL